MAIIDGKQPEDAEPVEWSPRVVIKLRHDDGTSGRDREGSEGRGDGRAVIPESLARLVAELEPGARLEPYLGQADAEHLSTGRASRLAGYLAVTLPGTSERHRQGGDTLAGRVQAAEALAHRIDALDVVATAYVEAGPTPPPAVNAADDPRSVNQGYLDGAPDGIGARWAWNHTEGRNVGFVDLEQGWTLNHEDLAAAAITVISGVDTGYRGHGTAVLGEVVMVDNGRGGVGIAPGASARVVSQFRNGGGYSTAAAILSAVDAMSAGDVLLLEAQIKVGTSDYLPVEVEQAVFDAIVAATDAGIVVVEAAGNGSTDLDEYTDAAGNRILRRGDEHFRDSGAVMVGAASAASPHTRLAFSNFGSRIDCFAWGESIDTTGDGWMGTSTTGYTTGFGGTSGASPIVSGAAVLVQSFRRRTRGRVFAPSDLRELLTSTLNTASGNPTVDRIGVMPDLRRIIEKLIDDDRFRVPRENYEQWGYILFGILDDAPGLIWVPGKGPVPVDPDWAAIGLKGLDRFAELLVGELRGGADVQLSAEQVRTATEAAVHGMLARP